MSMSGDVLASCRTSPPSVISQALEGGGGGEWNGKVDSSTLHLMRLVAITVSAFMAPLMERSPITNGTDTYGDQSTDVHLLELNLSPDPHPDSDPDTHVAPTTPIKVHAAYLPGTDIIVVLRTEEKGHPHRYSRLNTFHFAFSIDVCYRKRLKQLACDAEEEAQSRLDYTG